MIERHRRPYAEVRELMLARARAGRNPFDLAELADVERAFASLDTLEHGAWAAAFSAVARPHEERARAAEAAGDPAAARDEWLRAYACYRVARYPAPTSPPKREAYGHYRRCFMAAARAFDPPLERIEIPFAGRPGEGSAMPVLLRRAGRAPSAVLVTWGGIDSFKEDAPFEPYLARGLSVLALDMPGTGEAPLAGSADAERMWDPVFDWIARDPRLDERRVGLLGRSTGGYWAAKLAHTHRERVAAAVDHGGPAHHAFTAEWIERAQHGSYPFELAETLAWAFGLEGAEGWVRGSPRLSLVTLGVLERPCAPLLLVNGVGDTVFPIADMHLLLEHGSVKSARFFPGDHMGHAPATLPTIEGWLAERLRL